MITRVWFKVGSYQISRVTGGGRSTLVRDASLWDWFSPDERGDSSDIAAEVTYPKRLVQQLESEEEMSHGYLDTRVKNTTGGTSVSIDYNGEVGVATCFY